MVYEKNRIFLFSIVFALLSVLGFFNQANAFTTSSRNAGISDIASMEFYAVKISEKGKNKSLSGEEKLRVKFSKDRLTLKSNCNSLNGGYSLVKGVLVVKTLSSTKMACGKKIMLDDEWTRKFFTSRPKIKVVNVMKESVSEGSISVSSSSYLLLTSGSSEIRLMLMGSAGEPGVKDPVNEEAESAKAREFCARLVSMSANEERAVLLAKEASLVVRVVARDGEEYPVTADYSPGRVNIRIVNKLVTGCSQG